MLHPSIRVATNSVPTLALPVSLSFVLAIVVVSVDIADLRLLRWSCQRVLPKSWRHGQECPELISPFLSLSLSHTHTHMLILHCSRQCHCAAHVAARYSG